MKEINFIPMIRRLVMIIIMNMKLWILRILDLKIKNFVDKLIYH